jgi:AcrR family transcriptional regulator
MITQRTAKDSPKATALLSTAKQLFYRHGIRRVSVEEICREANVSKMTFYRFFKNKNSIVIRIIDDLVNGMMLKMDDLMTQDIEFGEKMAQMNAFKIAAAEEFGNEFFTDLFDDDSDAGQYMIKKRSEALEQIRGMYADAQDRGEIRKELNVDFMVHMANYLRGFMQDEALQKIYPNSLDLMKAISDFYLYGILSRDKKD